MAEPSDEGRSATKVFEVANVYAEWDSDYYDPISAALYDRTVAAMLDALDATSGKTVLDAGCGPGVHSVRAIRRGCRVHAIDISEVALDETRRRASAEGLAGSLTTAREDLTRLTLADASFEAVFSWGVLTHIPEIEKALAELARVLRPGGRLAIQINNRTAWDHKLEAFARALRGRPNRDLQHLPYGDGCWYDFHGEKLWVWQANLDAIADFLARRGLVERERRAVELTHVHQRIPGPLRSAVLRGNNLWQRLGLPPGPAVTNLAVFEKR